MSLKIPPKYSLEFSFPSLDAKIEDPEQLHIRRKEVTPSNANINPQILEVIESLCKDYICSLERTVFKEPIKLKLSFSPKEGISFDQGSKKIQELYKEKSKDLVIAIPTTEAKSLGITHLKKKNASEEAKRKATDRFGNEPVLFFDHETYLMWSWGIKTKMAIDVELNASVLKSQGGGQTTGFLRFPHMLCDLANRFEDQRLNEQTKICIVGPGLYTPKKGVVSCPQFVEVLSLFPKADFLLLDNDKPTLDRMENQFHKCKFAAYDPTMLRVYTTKGQFCAPEKYQGLFQEMKDLFAKNALSSNAKSLLDGHGVVQPIMLKVDPEKIHLREFDITHSTPEENEKGTFDIVVATMSIILTFEKESKQHPILLLKKFLELLKENGSLYLDCHLLDRLYQTYGKDIMDLGTRYLEQELGNQLSIEKVLLSDFLPTACGDASTTLNLTATQSKNLDTIPDVTTSSVVVITRTAKKAEAISEEQKAEIETWLPIK